MKSHLGVPRIAASAFRDLPALRDRTVTVPEQTDRLLAVREVAGRMGVTGRQIYKLTAAGRFPAAVKLAGSTRWRDSDIALFLSLGCDMTAFTAQRDAQAGAR